MSYLKTMSCLLACGQNFLHDAATNEAVVRYDNVIIHYTVTQSFAINVLDINHYAHKRLPNGMMRFNRNCYCSKDAQWNTWCVYQISLGEARTEVKSSLIHPA